MASSFPILRCSRLRSSVIIAKVQEEHRDTITLTSKRLPLLSQIKPVPLVVRREAVGGSRVREMTLTAGQFSPLGAGMPDGTTGGGGLGRTTCRAKNCPA